MTKKSKSNGKHHKKFFKINDDLELAEGVSRVDINAPKPRRKKSGARAESVNPMSKTYDIYKAYSEAVQNCEKEVHNLINLDKHLQHTLSRLELPRFPKIMREDFCGTAKMCEVWARSHVSRAAYGLDLDPEPVNYGLARMRDNGSNLDRIKLFVGNVLDFEYDAPPNYNHPQSAEGEDFGYSLNHPEIEPPSDEEDEEDDDVTLATRHIPKADLICSLNYALFFFRQRADLVRYLTLTRNRLKAKGTLICDIFGGLHACHAANQLSKRCPDFDYYLNISDYNPLGQTVKLGLNFKFKDGSWNKSKFHYTFRVYSMKEILEALEEAGFQTVEVWMASAKGPVSGHSSESDENDQEESNEGSEDDEEDGDTSDVEEDPFADYKLIDRSIKQFPDNWNAYIVASPTVKYQ